MEKLNDWEALSATVAQIIRDAGGTVVGRTRLQKMVCFLNLAGFDDNFIFHYKHFGPYSELLYSVSKFAAAEHKITEDENRTTWGGWYSTYRAEGQGSENPARLDFCHRMVDANLIELELAATAAFLAAQGEHAPWDETAARKANKATPERLQGAKALYGELLKVQNTPKSLPAI